MYCTDTVFCFYVVVFSPGDFVDEVSQVISELVPVRADWLVSFTSCAVQ